MELVHDRVKGDPFFRRRWGGGVFFPAPYHLGVFVPRSPSEPLLVFPSGGEI